MGVDLTDLRFITCNRVTGGNMQLSNGGNLMVEQRQASGGAVWIVESDGTAAGHVVLTTRFAMEFGGLIGYIDDLFVRPGYRRRGAARVALDALVAECQRRGCRSLIVEVGPDNAGAIALYRRVGLRLRADARQTMEIVWPAAG